MLYFNSNTGFITNTYFKMLRNKFEFAADFFRRLEVGKRDFEDSTFQFFERAACKKR